MSWFQQKAIAYFYMYQIWLTLNASRDRIFPYFQNGACYEKYLKDNKHNCLHLALKLRSDICSGHYLFLKAHSFPRTTLSENCSLLGTDYVRRQMSEPILTPNGGYYMWFPLLVNVNSITRLTRVMLKYQPIYICQDRTHWINDFIRMN